jgi:hypothetical protein
LLKFGGQKNLGKLLRILLNVIEKSFINWRILPLHIFQIHPVCLTQIIGPWHSNANKKMPHYLFYSQLQCQIYLPRFVYHSKWFYLNVIIFIIIFFRETSGSKRQYLLIVVSLIMFFNSLSIDNLFSCSFRILALKNRL